MENLHFFISQKLCACGLMVEEADDLARKIVRRLPDNLSQESSFFDFA